MWSNPTASKYSQLTLQAVRLIFRQLYLGRAQELRSYPRICDPARVLLLSDPNKFWPLRLIGIGQQKMGFDGFFSLPPAAQAGIIAFGIALLLLIIAQLLMASSLRNRSQSAALDGLRKEVRALTQSTEGGPAPHSANGLAPPPRPVKRRKVRRQPK